MNQLEGFDPNQGLVVQGGLNEKEEEVKVKEIVQEVPGVNKNEERLMEDRAESEYVIGNTHFMNHLLTMC